MAKSATKKHDITLQQMLQQGASSRFDKAEKALDQACELLPETETEGTAAQMRQVIKHLQTATENLSELMAYRKMAGID